MTSGGFLVPLMQVQMQRAAPGHAQMAFGYLQEGECNNLPRWQLIWKEPLLSINSGGVAITAKKAISAKS